MEWNKESCIGFDAIDLKREELFRLIIKLVDVEVGKADEKLFPALKATAEYASHQFPVEEELMRDVFFPGLIEHLEQHNYLKKQVSAYLVSLKEGNVSEPEEIVRFLLRWLNNHILGSDLKFSRYRDSTFEKQEEFVKEQKSQDEKHRPLEKIQKLKSLFKEKLISIDDFKERKIKILADYCRQSGLEKLKSSLHDLELFQKEDHISEKERKQIIQDYLGKLDLEKSLVDMKEIEGKLILLNSFFEFELVNEEKYLDLKDRVLNEI